MQINEYGGKIMTQLNRYEERGSRDLGNKLLFFLIGGSIGAAVALLFAPKSGDELRGDIADATRRGYGTALDKAKELKEKSTEVVSNVREKAGEIYVAAADKASVAGEVASNVLADAKKRFAEGAERISEDIKEDIKPITGDRKSSAIM